MPIDLSRTFRVAVAQLKRERDTIDQQIAAIQAVLGSDSLTRRRRVRASSGRRRRRTSAAARRAVSQRMTAYWAKRRESKQSAKAEPSGRRPKRPTANPSRPATHAPARTNVTQRRRAQRKKAA
jgi:hypothetical protein